MMPVLGDVGEMREEAKGANDLHSLLARETVERRLEIVARCFLVVAMESDRGLANALHNLEGRLALLFAHGIAEDPTEEADVLAQRNILVGDFALGWHSAFRAIGTT